MNWRQQLFDASPLSRLVALQQALIRINSHSIIFSLSKHLCISEPPVYSLNTQGQLLPTSMNRNSFLRLKVPILSSCLSLNSSCWWTQTQFIISYYIGFLICMGTVIHLLIKTTGFFSIVYSIMKKGKHLIWIWIWVFGQHRVVAAGLMSHPFHWDSY